MIARKLLTPMPQRKRLSEFAYQPFPKSIEEPSIATWSSPGKAMKTGPTGGPYRSWVIRRQHGTR
jgi:hypothetical protein